MNRKTVFVFFIILAGLPGISYAQGKSNEFKVPVGLYFSQEPPGNEARPFARDIITYEPHSSPSISPDGKEMIIDSMEEGCRYYRMVDGAWTLQPALPVDLPGLCNGAIISPSGHNMYFYIWDNNGNVFYVSKKKGDKWSKLQALGQEVNAYKSTWQFSVAGNENLYFSHNGILMVSKYDGEHYLEPEALKMDNDENILGVTPFIAPDESYLIYSLSYERADADLNISFRLENNIWTGPVNLGYSINIKGNMDLCPKVSPDGKYLFFISRRPGPDYVLYWVDAKIIEELKP
jgi:Tol biopolymer transport system component